MVKYHQSPDGAYRVDTELGSLEPLRDIDTRPPTKPQDVREALRAAKRTLAAYQEAGAPHAFVGDISLQKVTALIDAALAQSDAPGHTDLMVRPETIDEFMEKNPLPQSDAEPVACSECKDPERCIENARCWESGDVIAPPRPDASDAEPMLGALNHIARLTKHRDALIHVLQRCQMVLGNMAMENDGALFNRWPIHHEPLRSDAKHLLPLIEATLDAVPALLEPAPPRPDASGLIEAAELTIECAIGGKYEMQDGRSFWIDGQVAQEMTRRVLAALRTRAADRSGK